MESKKGCFPITYSYSWLDAAPIAATDRLNDLRSTGQKPLHI
jgi:hypothetical protein